MSIHPEAQAVLDFWLDEATAPYWFEVSADFDRQLTERFGQLLKRAARGELYTWRDSALGRVAEIIVLDQFSRNIYRGTPEAFKQDGMALVLAQHLGGCCGFCRFRQLLSKVGPDALYAFGVRPNSPGSDACV